MTRTRIIAAILAARALVEAHEQKGLPPRLAEALEHALIATGKAKHCARCDALIRTPVEPIDHPELCAACQTIARPDSIFFRRRSYSY